MLAEIIDFDRWTAPPADEVAESLTKGKDSSDAKFNPVSWKSFKHELSPLTLYLYLKARFGKPNGIAMLGWQQSIDNIIHWHYTIYSHQATINFWGHSSGLEITISSKSNDVDDSDRSSFIVSLKADFAKHGKSMGEVKKQLEHWSLFINPFVRLNQTLQNLTNELENIDLSAVAPLHTLPTEEETKLYTAKKRIWVNNTTRAAALGTALRMLFPVVIESFINLLIFTFRKTELKEDVRLYEGHIRQQIDIRVKSLHMICDGFKGAIDGNDPRFKAFHTLMNGRNDFLHGNVDPVKMQLEDIFFDEQFIPLFSEDDGIINKMIPKYLAHVSLTEVQNDERTVNDFIELIMERLEESAFQTFYALFAERFPGINKKSKVIRVVVSDDFAEGMLTFSGKAVDDPSYQLFLNDEGTFEMFIPATWRHYKKDDRHYFKPYEIYNPENLIVSITKNESGKTFIDTFTKDSEAITLGDKVFYINPVAPGLHVKSYFHSSDDASKFALFTYTYPDHIDPDLEWRSHTQMITDAEKILASFSFIDSSDKVKKLLSARYSAFVRGIATGQLLFNRAIENKAFFEAIIIMKNQIDALLRIAIVLSDQIKYNTDAIDLNWIYQDEKQATIPFKTMLTECLNRGIIDEALFKTLSEKDDRQTFILNNFVVSAITLPIIQDFAKDLYHMSETINIKVAALEEQQVKLGLGIGKNIRAADEKFYRNFIKAKLGK